MAAFKKRSLVKKCPFSAPELSMGANVLKLTVFGQIAIHVALFAGICIEDLDGFLPIRFGLSNAPVQARTTDQGCANDTSEICAFARTSDRLQSAVPCLAAPFFSKPKAHPRL
jgi:hypothetical protein